VAIARRQRSSVCSAASPCGARRELYPAAVGPANSAAAARQLSLHPAAPLRPDSGRNKFLPGVVSESVLGVARQTFAICASALFKSPSPGKRQPAGYAIRHLKAQSQAPRANALSLRHKSAVLFRDRRARERFCAPRMFGASTFQICFGFGVVVHAAIGLREADFGG